MKKKLLNSFMLALALLFSAGAWAEDVTFDFEANPWGHPTGSSSEVVSSIITEPLELQGASMLIKQGAGKAPYYCKTMSNTIQLRVLKNNVMKIYAPAGKAVTKIEFTAPTFNLSAEGLTDKTWTGNATYVKFKPSGSCYLTKMVVTLASKNNETVTPPAEAEEIVFLDIDDAQVHSAFDINNGESSYLSEDLVLVDGHLDYSDTMNPKIDGESRVTTIFKCSPEKPSSKATYRNRIQRSTRSGAYTTSVRLFDGTITMKTDPDKVIKTLKMDIGTNCYFSTINGNPITKAELTAGYDVNANEVVLAIDGEQTTATIIYSLTYTLADKPAAAEVTPIAPTAFDPADNSTLGSYFSAAFTAKFDEALTLDSEKAAQIKLYKGSVDAANEIAPEAGAWSVRLENSNRDLYIFSMDEYGEGVQTIITEEGQKYILVIPAGIVKNASDVANDELTLTLNGPVPTIKMTAANPANNSEVASAFAATFNVTFDKAITINNAKAAEVKLYVDAVGGTEIAPEAGAWSLDKESDGKTLRIYSLDEFGEGPQFITPEAGKKYILVVPAGIVKSAAEAENEEIKITLVCPEPAPIAPTAFDPAEGSVLPNYFSASFTAKFDEALTLDESKVANIKLYEKMGETTTELTPDDSWKASLESGKKNLFIWAADYDGFTQVFAAKEGAKYQLVIPAGIVKNAANVANDELTLTLNGPVPTVSLVSTDPVDGAKLAAGYTAKSFSLTFSKAVSTTDELINSGVTLKKNGAVVDTESWGFSLSNENKTVQVFGKDMDGYTDTYQVAAGDVFVLTIAKDVFTTADGAKNDEIQVTLNGPELVITELVLESSNPANGAVLEAGYQPMTFNLTFAEATTTTAEKLNAGVTLTKNGTKVDVESWGFSLSNENKTVQLFGMDMDGYTDSYKVEEGDVFVLTIAKGVFTAPTAQNEEIKITLNGPAAPAAAFNPTKIEPGDGDELFKFYANYAMPHLELTFDGNIAQVLQSKPAIELRKGSADGEVLPIPGWKAVVADEQPNMLLIDAWDYNTGNNVWFEAEDVDYYWVIPAGIVKNAEGGQNEVITLSQKGIVKPLTVVSTTPTNKSSVDPGYKNFQFYVTFEEDIEIAVATPNDVKFYENDAEKLPFGADDVYAGAVDVWHALKEDAKSLYIWGDDGYGLVDSYQAVAGATYKLVIPAGVVKDAKGNANGEITIEFTCSAGDGINVLKVNASDKDAAKFNIAGQRVDNGFKGLVIKGGKKFVSK